MIVHTVDMKARWRSLSPYRFFGLTANTPQKYYSQIKQNILEDIFVAVYYGKLSFSDAYNMPSYLRRWWVNKVVDVIKKENQNKSKQ